jgi:8-oxo-dGTP pyrophosphatase MutT (NUDIX family)
MGRGRQIFTDKIDYMRPVNAYSAGGIVLKKENDKTLILLIKHEDGFLVFPKGHINYGETEEEAALREVKEEAGLINLKIVRKLGIVVRPAKENSGEVVQKRITLFLMQCNNYQHHKAEEDYGWFTHDQAINNLGFKQEKQFLKSVWNHIST